ncbi:hypothetical protein CBS101457_005753 [Exobasidium rhododendri]|nr:hypothetical protein CBS101457_005753 [Exobasidium rhododendri]
MYSQFADKESEARYWKSQCQDLQDTLTDTENSLHEFMDSSKELEKEMDREISAANAKRDDYQLRSEKLKGDVDEWKTKYQRALSDHNKTLAELNRELTTLRDSHNNYKNKLRDMELDNDELENAERMVASSLNDMESRYNKTIERTALLEEELVEKSRLEEENQRLKDELQEVNEELAVLRDSLSANRPMTRMSTPAGPSSSNGRSSVDELQLNDLMSRQRPSSRSNGLYSGRPPSRSSAKHSPPTPRSALPSSNILPNATQKRFSSSTRIGLSSHTRTDSREAKAALDGALSPHLINSPSSTSLRARQSPGPGSLRTGVRANPRFASTSLTPRDQQPGGSKFMIGDMFQRMRALEKRLADTRNGLAINDVQSAIPRPSSRLSSSIGPGGGAGNGIFTPRKSMNESRRGDDHGTPSSIPVPLSKSTSRPPHSRLSMAAAGGAGVDTTIHHYPSSIRCQTPTLESGATLDFLDQDPSKLRRRSHLAMVASTNNPSALGQSSGSGGRPRGSTLTQGAGHPSRTDSFRRSVYPVNGRTAVTLAPSSKAGQPSDRPRSSSSIGTNS